MVGRLGDKKMAVSENPGTPIGDQLVDTLKFAEGIPAQVNNAENAFVAVAKSTKCKTMLLKKCFIVS
jgi:hypothetical protein